MWEDPCPKSRKTWKPEMVITVDWIRMTRWNAQETSAISKMREILKDDISHVAPNVEVVGDRCFVRFYRGHEQNIETACEYMRNYLRWRKDNNVDMIRENIVYNGYNNPNKFPHADVILRIMPQTICNATMCDNHGRPLTVFRMNFSISDFSKNVTQEQFVEFLTYAMEYHNVVLEQLAEKREREILDEARLSGTPITEPYGVLMEVCAIRNMDGLGFEHLGPYGFHLLRTVVSLLSDNYPEMLGRYYIINMPYVLYAFLSAIKALVPARTLKNVVFCDGNFEEAVLTQVTAENLPQSLRGTREENTNCDFEFDTSKDGLLSLRVNEPNHDEDPVCPPPSCVWQRGRGHEQAAASEKGQVQARDTPPQQSLLHCKVSTLLDGHSLSYHCTNSLKDDKMVVPQRANFSFDCEVEIVTCCSIFVTLFLIFLLFYHDIKFVRAHHDIPPIMNLKS